MIIVTVRHIHIIKKGYILLSSKLLDKSPLTSIYFTTFEKKRRVRSPQPHTTKLFGFWYNVTFFDYMSTKTQLFKFFQFSPSEILLSINFLGNFNLNYQNLKFFNFIYTKEHISITT